VAPTQKRKKLTVASKIFLGLMIMHHRVHIAPVAVSARFCWRERASTGRKKSDTPARTIPHYFLVVNKVVAEDDLNVAR
jgi:hypothetical protein